MAVKRAKIIEPEDLKKLFKDIDSSHKEALRDKVTVLLSAKAGLRAAEIAGLRWTDVTRANGEIGDNIYVGSHIAKGGRARTVPIHADVKPLLIKLRKERPGDEHIRYGDYKPTISANALTVWFHRLYKLAGLDGCSSHSGRRTFITGLARNCNLHGGSMRDVQMLAGHSNLTTTERYIEASDSVRAMVNNV